MCYKLIAIPILHLMERSRRDGNEDEFRKKRRVGGKIWGFAGYFSSSYSGYLAINYINFPKLNLFSL